MSFIILYKEFIYYLELDHDDLHILSNLLFFIIH
jgi:hypothetical protein